MAGAKCLLRTPSNFQSSAMFDVTETTADGEGVSSESTVGSSVTACKKVLCSNSLLDSSEYWLRNDKPLCRLTLLEQRSDRSCTTVCFINLDRHNGDRHDDSCIKKLASVSPELPRLIESLGVRQPKENEILLLSGLQPPEPFPPAHAQAQSSGSRCVFGPVCEGASPTQPGSIIFEINKFLIGLQSGQEKQRLSRLANQRVADDDTNRSVSSIEEDFLTASEHLGEDSEDDPFRNEADSVDVGEVAVELLMGAATCLIIAGAQLEPLLDQNDSEDSESTLRPSSSFAASSSQNPQESAGRYATNLAESVLQDAFIRLSQDEAPFSPAAALSLPSSSSSSSSFQLPKIVIVQSPDCGEEGASDWPDHGPDDTSRAPAERDRPSPKHQPHPQHQPHRHHHHHHNHHHHHHHPHSKHQHQRHNQEAQQQQQQQHSASKPVEVALACAANVIGTISTPQVAQHLTLESARAAPEAEEEGGQTEEEEEEECGMDEGDFSLTSAMCGMAQVAGAVAAVDLPFDPAEPDDGDLCLDGGRYSPSLGLLSAAQASAAVPLHASLAEGTSVEASRASLARALLSEATSLLARPRPPQQRSVAQLLESTQRRILAGVTGAERRLRDEEQEEGEEDGEEEPGEVECEEEEDGGEDEQEEEEGEEEDEFVRGMAESVLAHALEKAEKRRELEGREKDAGGADWEAQLRESAEGVLFGVLRLTARRLSHVASRTGRKSNHNRSRGRGAGDRHSQVQEQGGGRGGGGAPGSHTGSPQRIRKPSGDGERVVSVATEQEGGVEKVRGKLEREKERSMETKLPSLEGSPRHDRLRGRGQEVKPYTMSPQHSLGETRTPITCFAEDLATTVVSMATELAAICLENSSGKQPWFCALKGAGALSGVVGGGVAGGVGLEAGSYLLPACRTAAAGGLRKKHRPPRLSEIKRKTEEQPELMERLVNRVVDETVNLDLEPVGTGSNGHHHGNNFSSGSNNTNGISDPFALFASEVTARILNCPELSVVDTSSASTTASARQQGPPSASATSSPCPSSPRGRLQCERWSSRGKAASCESIPEEEPSGLGGRGGVGGLAGGITLGPGSRLGPDLSRGSSVSKQSSCESITDEFSRFMVGQMEAEGRGFDLLLDYYAGKSASAILQAAMQQAVTGGRRNGHLSLRSSSCCLSKQSSTESITEEFYRYMLRNMDKEARPELVHFGGGYGAMSGLSRAKEWSNSLLPPSPSGRSLFCVRQSSVPDRRSSDSRLSVTAPIKANSFDGFARGSRGSTSGAVGEAGALSVRPAESASVAGLCKSDSCLYRLGQTDRATDILIHDTWSSSIEALMRKNKIISDQPDDSCDPCEVMEMATTSSTAATMATTTQPGVCNFASRLAADIVEGGRSAALGAGGQAQQQQEVVNGRQQQPLPVGERRRGFKQSRPMGAGAGPVWSSRRAQRGAAVEGGPRDVPLIHIEPDQREESGEGPVERSAQVGVAQRGRERTPAASRTSDRDKAIVARPMTTSAESGPPQNRSLSNSSEDSGSGSWAQVVAPDDDLPEETSSFIYLSEGNGNSSTSSLGLVDLESFQETSSQRMSDESEKKDALKESLEESPSSTCTGGSSARELLVLNFDLEADSVDVELRAALQWMAASELGTPALHFKKSQQHNIHKFQRVVQLVSHRSWRVGDLFGAVVQYCQQLEGRQDTAPPAGLFDWLLETR